MRIITRMPSQRLGAEAPGFRHRERFAGGRRTYTGLLTTMEEMLPRITSVQACTVLPPAFVHGADILAAQLMKRRRANRGREPTA
jgi:hypothetical protein